MHIVRSSMLGGGVQASTQLAKMFGDLPIRLSRALLAVLTVAAVVAAILNLQQQRLFELPDDGVTWIDGPHGVEALRVAASSPAERSGLRPGDVLHAINGVAVRKALSVPQILFGIGTWKRAEYRVARHDIELRPTLIIQPVARNPLIYYLYIVGLLHLLIGLYVFFRREGAPKSQHFYLFCLASFLLYSFHYTGKLNGFDRLIYWGNVWALLFAPPLFLHFCLTFAETGLLARGRRAVAALCYAPAGVLLAAYVLAANGALRTPLPLVELRWVLDKLSLGLLTASFLAGYVVLHLAYRQATVEDSWARPQLKWLKLGTFWGVAPFIAGYAIPYLLGRVPGSYMSLSVLSLGLVPLTFAYAIARYRLMDVDVIFRRGFAYSLATMTVLGAFYALIFTIGDVVHQNFRDLGQAGWIAAVLVAAFLFQPLRAWIQERLDRYFYRERYDYRRTLIEFARELNAETDLAAMLASVTERIAKTLGIERVAVFLQDGGGKWNLAHGLGIRDRQGRGIQPGDYLDLAFLEAGRPEANLHARPYVFFESTRWRLDGTASERSTIADLDLTYYLPCLARSRTVAFLGLGRTLNRDYLSGDDLELLMTLAGSLGIAIDNARLYQSLQQKVAQYERLKDFSENIVESIHVGILAVDLEDRVESWNTQLELMYGISRDQAVGRTLGELFPEDLVKEFVRVREETGVHNVFKYRLRPEALPAATDGAKPPTSDRILNLAIAPLVAKNFDRIGRLIIFDDVTDRIELEQQLVQAEKLSSLGLLAAGVAHEVNTPLAVISTYAQMLARQVSEDEQKARLLDKIAAQTFRASEIVNSLLNFSRTSPTEFTPVDLNRTVQETISLLDHQFKKARVHVEAELDPSLPAIDGNNGKLQQVFLNLFLNAKDAMPEGGRLLIRTAGPNGDASGQVRVEVIDTGSGIAPEHLNRIYDPFFTTKGVQKGTGLGLAVTYGILQEHSGTISVESEVGRGTCFRLEFPVAAGSRSVTPVRNKVRA